MVVDVPALSSSVEQLLAGAQRREPFVNPDGRSSAAFERVWIDGVAHIVKYLHLDDDFTMRVSGDVGCRPVRAWAAGLLDAAPGLVDHAVVGAAFGHGRNGWGAALLMRDVTAELLPQGEALIDPEQHAVFVDHLAGFCAATWGWRDDPVSGPGLLPYATRWAWFGHAALDAERALGWPERAPRLADEGWRHFADRAPAPLARLVDDLLHDPAPLAEALRQTPSCLLHGDVKASNAGRTADGRTVLIDWAYVGEGPACHELTWHLALDRARLPISKEATTAATRAVIAAGAGVVVAVDAAFGMLAHLAANRPPAAVGDAIALPFADASFDAAVAAFSLNHLLEPAAGLCEMARVTRRGGPLLVASYAADDAHPVKAAVEAALSAWGWTPDPWYVTLRAEATAGLATVAHGMAAAAAAGLDASVEVLHVPFPELDAHDLVEWRLGLAQHAPFVARLPPAAHDAVAADAMRRLGDQPPSLVRSVLVVRAVSP